MISSFSTPQYLTLSLSFNSTFPAVEVQAWTSQRQLGTTNFPKVFSTNLNLSPCLNPARPSRDSWQHTY